jgi:cytochrome c-type biogenesis protein CcsB
MKKHLLALALLSFLALPVSAQADDPAAAATPPKHPSWSFESAREIPLQGGGRIKPLDSFAREVVLFETGSRTFQGWDPIDMLFSQLSAPDVWDKYPFIQVSREDVRRQLGLDEKRTRFTPHELMTNSVLAQYAMTASSQGSQVAAPIANSPKADPREQEFKHVFERLGAFRRVISGEAWTIVPASPAAAQKKADAPWMSLADNDPSADPIRMPFVGMVKSYQRSDEGSFNTAATQAKTAIEAKIPAWTGTAHTRVTVEARYNHLRPFLAAWIIYLIAALVWIIARAVTSAQPGATATSKPETAAARRWTQAALLLTATAAACQIVGVAMRCYVAGRPPVTNMYESIIWVSLGQMVFASILYAIHRQGIVLLVSCVLATAGLIAADAAPAMMDPGLHPLVPVLRSNYWLTIHVLTITLGYAAFALTLGLGNVSLWNFLKSDKPGAKVRIASMNQLTYRSMQFGVVLLAAGTILGGIWADYSWGRFWGWDPKEVWALIALLCYLTILHGRFAGWVGQFGFAAWSVISFLSVLMAWYGVNFVLGVGLHSYGFSTGGFTAIMTFISIQLAWVGFVMWVYKRREGAAKGPAAAAAPATTL